jgi:hypothetical protein
LGRGKGDRVRGSAGILRMGFGGDDGSAGLCFEPGVWEGEAFPVPPWRSGKGLRPLESAADEVDRGRGQFCGGRGNFGGGSQTLTRPYDGRGHRDSQAYFVETSC